LVAQILRVLDQVPQHELWSAFGPRRPLGARQNCSIRGAGKRPVANWGAYAVSKWGVEGFTKCLAEELKDTGIKVIAVNPGGTRTGMRASAFPEEDPRTLKTPEKLARWIVALATGKIKCRSGDSMDYPAC